MSTIYVPFDPEKQVDDFSIEAPRDGENGELVKVHVSDEAADMVVYLPYGYDEAREEGWKWIAKASGVRIIDDFAGLLIAGIVLDEVPSQLAVFRIQHMDEAFRGTHGNHRDAVFVVEVPGVVYKFAVQGFSNIQVSGEAAERIVIGVKFFDNRHLVEPQEQIDETEHTGAIHGCRCIIGAAKVKGGICERELPQTIKVCGF